jgi:hypothetical protein
MSSTTFHTRLLISTLTKVTSELKGAGLWTLNLRGQYGKQTFSG